MRTARTRADGLTRPVPPAARAPQVQNSKTEERIHLLLDFSETPMTCQQLTPGQQCEYSPKKGIVC